MINKKNKKININNQIDEYISFIILCMNKINKINRI